MEMAFSSTPLPTDTVYGEVMCEPTELEKPTDESEWMDHFVYCVRYRKRLPPDVFGKLMTPSTLIHEEKESND